MSMPEIDIREDQAMNPSRPRPVHHNVYQFCRSDGDETREIEQFEVKDDESILLLSTYTPYPPWRAAALALAIIDHLRKVQVIPSPASTQIDLENALLLAANELPF